MGNAETDTENHEKGFERDLEHIKWIMDPENSDKLTEEDKIRLMTIHYGPPDDKWDIGQ